MTFPPSMATGSTHHSPSSPEMKKDKLKLGGSFSPGNPFLTQQQSHLREQADGEGPESARSLQEAQRISREIDESLQETKRALEKKKKAVRILLLGQSESGKSSVLKNFQLAFSPKHFQSERAAWKTIVQLNLIGSIKTILEVLKEEWDTPGPAPPTPTLPTGTSSKSAVNPNLRRIRLGLSPLLFIETTLMHILSPENRGGRDVCVRAGSGWKSLLSLRKSSPPVDIGRRRSSMAQSNSNDPTFVLAASKDDILVLWEDADVQEVLRRHKIRLEALPGFFLNDISRIASLDYQPTDSDIIRARVRTFGIEEHHFIVEKGIDAGAEVYITDVGGSRGGRAAWIPYFDDVQAILFLAPLAFNQTLEEEPKINRLEDSLALWREICSNKLLANSNLILFLNKKDVLTATLASGVRVKKYVPSYGDAPNEVAHVTKYFKDKFNSYHRKLSPKPRSFMCYETSAIDTTSMAAILVGVREIILRQHLQQGDMI